jgi:ABC-2 type transport system ATP-binding protein
MGNIISIRSVTRRYGKLLAVDELSFEVVQGEIFGLLGPNGAGKTTMMNLITGMLTRDSGEISVLSFDPQRQARKVHQKIGYVPQETNVYMDLSGEDNLWHHAALYCKDLKVVEGQIKSLLELMNLWERRKDPMRTYSGGMKRRLALARALLHEPKIILFDEPTLGVDVQGKHAIWDHIKEQCNQGKTFIVCTNDMMEADVLCDRLVILDHGAEIALDTPENLKAALGRDIVTLRTAPEIEEPDRVLSLIDISGVSRPEPGMLRFEVQDAERLAERIILQVREAHRLESINIARPSLDDVFLHHTGRALRD